VGSDFRHLLPILIFGGGFGFVGTILYGAWLLGRYRGREEDMPVALENVEARLQRLEYALSRTTSALERLEAAHRFTHLMAEAPSEPVRAIGRQSTPH
jgi:hypothetical protein